MRRGHGSGADRHVVAALRDGDEGAFARLVRDWSRPMLAVARGFVSTDASAQEIVQETWLAVVRGIDGFEGRSSLRTWVFRILVNLARRRGAQEARSVPWTSVVGEDGPALDPTLFQGPGEPHPAHWRFAPAPWSGRGAADGADAVLDHELRAELDVVLAGLPPRQRTVLVLRDVLGHSAAEVCDLLDLSADNQRVLLHRARTAARAGLADYLAHDDETEPA